MAAAVGGASAAGAGSSAAGAAGASSAYSAGGSDALGSLVGGIFGLGGTIMAGKKNRRAAKKAWKRELWMYQNRYQLMVEDLKKAGINPMLAVGMGAGDTPSASVGAPYGNPLEGFAAGAMDLASKVREARTNAQELKIMKNQEEESFHTAGLRASQWAEQDEKNLIIRKERENWEAFRQKELEVMSASAREITARAVEGEWAAKYAQANWPRTALESGLDASTIGKYINTLKWGLRGAGPVLGFGAGFVGGATGARVGKGGVSFGPKTGPAYGKWPGGMRSK